jgi:hypothetical protein
MTHKEFRDLMKLVFDECLEVQNRKGRDYAGTGDALKVFKEQAADMRISPLQSWGVLSSKGWNAIKTFAATQEPGSEPLIQRVCDIINYSVFLLALAEEQRIETGFLVNSDRTVFENDAGRVTSQHHIHDFRGDPPRCTFPGCTAPQPHAAHPGKFEPGES